MNINQFVCVCGIVFCFWLIYTSIYTKTKQEIKIIESDQMLKVLL